MAVYIHNLGVFVHKFGSVLKTKPGETNKKTLSNKRGPEFVNATKEGPACFSLPTYSLHY